MPALRCPICLTSWPVAEAYDECPGEYCDFHPTDRISNAQPDMSKAEARSMRRHFDFDRFYETWDESHPASRLIPTEEEREQFCLPERYSSETASGETVGP